MKIDTGSDSSSVNSVLYHDNNALANIKNAADKHAALETVAGQFEAMFLQLVLRQMRSSSDVMADEDSPFNSKQQGVFRDMYDGQLAIEMAKKQRSGIADMLVKQLSPVVDGAGSNVVELAAAAERVSHNRSAAPNAVNNAANAVASLSQETTKVAVTNAFSQPLIRPLER
ncbi:MULTISPECIES: rod-binding protein [Vibrio]|uniref:rod-binding protein n=1 Tax=Vibrio TaxID=662 RepID=UPI0006E3C090|nr:MULTISPECIES: rod-binding protein [Vibrio]HDM8036434.1 rod-binding protein [Vibrio fluvialis clinical-1]EKO3455038.1 rod-binding protein [Vibrio fluvialis]EKO3470174.1 rod-binding protein [Vibrio fluvialis]EKO3500930.1 rod-binding protein [Vibrio fluvialis]EKO3946016.1 rod-binding protein [Vibrio fluvialis]